MRKNKAIFNILLTASLLFGGTPTFGQQSDEAKKSDIRDKAYRLITSSYDACATVNSSDDYYQFLRLFESEEVPVYNDLLGISADSILSVGDYARLLNGSGLSSKHIRIKNVQMDDDPTFTDGKWRVTVSFDKELSYYDHCNVFFSTREFYGGDYHLWATVAYDDVDGRCRIERIDGEVQSDKRLTGDYVVFSHTNKRDWTLRYHDEILNYNSNKQAIILGKFDEQGFSHPDYRNDELHPTLNDCRIVTMSYGGSSGSGGKMALRPYFGIGMGDPLKITGGEQFEGKKMSGYGFGLDFGFTFAETDALKFAAFAGLGLTNSSIKDLAYTNSDYSYAAKADADVDGDEYVRHYYGLSVGQDISLTELSIPVYIDMEYAFSDIIAAYADLGLRMNMNMSKSVDLKDAKADRVNGYYQKYGTTLGGEWGFNGFSDTDKDLASAATAEPTGVKGMNADFIGGLGLRFYIPHSSFAFDLGLGFQMGLGNMIEPEKNADGNNTPIIDYTVAGGESVASLTETFESVKRQTVRLNIGVIYRF